MFGSIVWCTKLSLRENFFSLMHDPFLLNIHKLYVFGVHKTSGFSENGLNLPDVRSHMAQDDIKRKEFKTSTSQIL